MKIVVFGLTLSSSWGNGHATVWRALLSGLHARGHRIVFFEADVPYYAEHRDMYEPDFAQLHLYSSWQAIASVARPELADADVAIVSSYCLNAIAASELVLCSRVPVRIFYDLDTPITLSSLEGSGGIVAYLPAAGLGDFDLVLSFTGGAVLDELKRRLGARRVAALYGSVDVRDYQPVPPVSEYGCELSYLGTYSPDRQRSVERLFVDAARRLPGQRFLLGGSLYPPEFPWKPNIWYLPHVAPQEHPRFYCSSKATLNVTRRVMASTGFCPSGRLFEAAACGTLIVSDDWPGMDQFFLRGSEILIVRDSTDVIDALSLSECDRSRIAHVARDRVLEYHTGAKRACEFETIVSASL